jgi:hypothetical protein
MIFPNAFQTSFGGGGGGGVGITAGDITGKPAATLPLAGTEELLLVQGGELRTVEAGDLGGGGLPWAGGEVIPLPASPTLGTNWTNDGGGAFSSTNATGFAAITFSLTGLLVDGGYYLLRVFYPAVTSGSLNVFLGANGGPGDQFSVIGGPTLVSTGYSQIWGLARRSGAAETLIVRTGNGFVGTISNLQLIRVL